MKTGDFVALIDDNLRGKIIKITPSKILLEDEFGFERWVLASEIVPIDEDLYQHRPVHVKPEPLKKISKKTKEKVMELDLHFDQLVEYPTNYSAWERLFIQKEKLQNTLGFCRKNKIKRLNIIHGLGDGVVQEMVLEVLRGETGIEYEDENLFKNESGSVMVYFI